MTIGWKRATRLLMLIGAMFAPTRGEAIGVDQVPCAACVTFAIGPGGEDDLRLAGADVATLLRPDEVETVEIGRTGPEVVVVDVRNSSIARATTRFALRRFATRLRSIRPHARLGIEVRPDDADGLPALRAYVDLLVLPADATVPPEAADFERWTLVTGAQSALDLASAPRLAGSDHVLVHAADVEPALIRSLVALRQFVPAGLTPLRDVTVSCDAPCEPAVYLDPATLDAIAIVTTSAQVRHLAVAPAAAELIVGSNPQRRVAGPDMDVSAPGKPLVFRIRGWRGVTNEPIAHSVDVRGTRILRVDEIVARHQAARARQDTVIRTLIATGDSVVAVQVPGFAGPVTVTAETVSYTTAGTTDVEQRHIRVNGLEFHPSAGTVPRLPVIEPERVSTPPLTIALTDAYGYVLRGRERIGDRDCYVIDFEPIAGRRDASFTGRAWIDTGTFGIVRLDTTETGLRGPIVSSRQIDTFAAVDHDGGIVWLLDRSEVFQVYQGPTESTPIHRVVTFTRHEVNPKDFDNRLNAALESDAVMLRDTPQGFRFLLRRGATASDTLFRRSASRQLAQPTDRVATLVAGSLFDPNISVPLVFAGVSYVDFNLLDTGAQLNAFFGGTYGRLAWSTAPVFGRWRFAGDASAVAVSFNDRAFSHGVEHYDHNVRQRPAQASASIVGPIAPHIRIRAGYEFTYTAYDRADTTAPAFTLPATTPVHAARLTVEAEHRAWTATAWWSGAVRQRWHAWGVTPPATTDGGAVAGGPGDGRFTRFGGTLARSIVRSPRAVGHVEAAFMSGTGLDRFSGFAFGTFDNPLRGYPSVSVRYDTGAVVRTVTTWTPAPRLRFDAFADCGVVRALDESRLRAYPGIGAAAELPAPFGWLAAIEWGYGVNGVNTNGSRGTNVIRITGYKIF